MTEAMEALREVMSATGLNKSEALEVLREAESSEDFELHQFRFINADRIDKIQQDELSGDPYALGCFNAWFLADILDIDTEIVEAAQSGEAFEALGNSVINGGHLADLQEAYAAADGYGHHFAHYDHETRELYQGEQSVSWFAFKVD